MGETELSDQTSKRSEEAIMAMFHAQQTRTWTANIIEGLETLLAEAGIRSRLRHPPAVCFLDITGYTRLSDHVAMAARTLGRSADRTFRDEGHAIQAMLDTVARLKESLTALNTDFYGQLAYLSRHADPAVARATWDAFVPAMSLTGETLLFAFATGVAVWLLFLAAWIGCARFMDVVLARGRPGEWAVPKKKKPQP